MKPEITREEIELAQQNWGNSLIEIGKAFLEKKDYTTLAKNHVNKFYAYDEGKVLFKPTRASKFQFRLTFDSALSYFIGNNPNFPYDTGFALQPWTNVLFENVDVIIKANNGVAMGNYFFTDYQGNTVKVEYTFAYYNSKKGGVKIYLHHSSIPYKH